jgi:dTDP-4-amino-4,6-dideoxygalactose transaminase
MPSFIGSIPTTDDSDMKLVHDIVSKKIRIDKSKDNTINRIRCILDKEEIFFFNRGREAIYMALQALGVSQNDEVLVQAMTCNAVVTPILCIGAKPVYVDISKSTFNIDVKDLKKKISTRSKVLIVQHTFGRFAEIEMMQKICKANDIKIIEDCAHLFRSDLKDTIVGRFSDISIFSFAQDKAISSVTGGLLVVNNSECLEKVKALYGSCSGQTKQESQYPLSYLKLWNFAKRYYFTPLLPLQKRITIGKVAIMVSRWLKITKQQASEHIECEIIPSRMSNIQHALLENQLNKLDETNKHRRDILRVYDDKSNDLLIRFPVLVENPESVLNLLSQNKYLCGRWYNSVVFPIKNLSDVGYIQDSCPTAEYVVKHIINLPLDMDITESDAVNIKGIVSKFLVH